MTAQRVRRDGKFLAAGEERLFVKGVSYGTFAPDARGEQFPAQARITADFAAMASHGVNTVRTYTVPGRRVLDEAARAGLKVMAGVPWAQHVAFLDDPALTRQIRRSVVAQVGELRDHPAVALVALGNEIPPSVVRWHGQARVERFLAELYDEVKSAAPELLFTYVNYPPTAYLELPCFDVCAFNVYLHDETKLRRYLARLQHVAGHRPLLLAEAGADSIREGLDGQAALTAMQLRAAFAEGACGAVAYAWTDEWWRGGQAVDDWAFGVVDHERRPKPAAAAVAEVFAEAPFTARERQTWPKVSVVVCAYNAADTLEDCLTSLAGLDYPDYEVIVVDDGSRDATPAIARRFGHVRLITTPNRGLSAARNVGLAAARGSIVAYTDADVRADRHWLAYLVQPFLTSDVVAAGGPNVVPPDDSWVAQCVARAPGGPTHVLFDDRTAEHVPGCNMAMRRDALLAIGGFNPIYLRAGDDVDVCWRLQARGGTIGFAPSALVWHHHRPSVKAFWRQQVGYGEGEAWLRPQHPAKFNGSRIVWRGHVYSPLPFVRSLFAAQVDAGPWGAAPFPSVYAAGVPALAVAPHTAGWMIGALVALVGGLLLLAGDVGGAGVTLAFAGLAALATTATRCVQLARASDIDGLPPLPGRSPATSRLVTRALIAWLHVVQPLARARGQLRGLMTAPEDDAASAPGRRVSWRGVADLSATLATRPGALCFWSEKWLSRETLLAALSDRLRSTRAAAVLELEAAWGRAQDLGLALGPWGGLDLQLLVEEHERGRVLVRVARRLRVTATVAGAILAAAAGTLGLDLAGAPLWLAVAPLVGLLVAAILTAWRVAGAMALVDSVAATLLLETGATPLGAHAQRVAAALRMPDRGAAPVVLGALEQHAD
jgi:GT2 family glycosyltransferase